MQITVTQKHIDAGKREDRHNCPVALALHDTGEWLEVSTDGIDIVLHNRRILAPEPVQEFMADFDKGKSVHPFTFELPV